MCLVPGQQDCVGYLQASWITLEFMLMNDSGWGLVTKMTSDMIRGLGL